MSNLIKPPSKERWADRIIVRVNAPEETARIMAKLSGPLPDCYEVGPNELQKTGFEIEAIKQIAALMDIMLRSVSLPPRGITRNRIHILEPAMYRLTLGARDDAKTVLGHTYITRVLDPAAEMFLLTHELAHLASYLSVICISDDTRHLVTWKRSGYAVQTHSRGFAFSGLNEAAAEIVAGLIRDMLVRKSGLLNKSAKKILSSGYIYAPQVRIVQTLVQRISEHEDIDNSEPLMSVISGFLTGCPTFLRQANRTIPGASAILRTMGDDPMSAANAACALGLHEIADDIYDYAHSRYDIEFK